ncbi:hypothetical protein [Paenibacillus sp. Marseille-Q9583]
MSKTHNVGFTAIPNVLYREYLALEDFTVETAGFYGFLRSWCQQDPLHHMHGKTWLNQREMTVRSGLSPYKIRSHVETLKKYGLLTVTKSSIVANKLIYEPLPPLTSAEFYTKYGQGEETEYERNER